MEGRVESGVERTQGREEFELRIYAVLRMSPFSSLMLAFSLVLAYFLLLCGRRSWSWVVSFRRGRFICRRHPTGSVCRPSAVVLV